MIAPTATWKSLCFYKHTLASNQIEIGFGFVSEEFREGLIDTGGCVEVVAYKNGAGIHAGIKPLEPGESTLIEIGVEMNKSKAQIGQFGGRIWKKALMKTKVVALDVGLNLIERTAVLLLAEALTVIGTGFGQTFEGIEQMHDAMWSAAGNHHGRSTVGDAKFSHIAWNVLHGVDRAHYLAGLARQHEHIAFGPDAQEQLHAFATAGRIPILG